MFRPRQVEVRLQNPPRDRSGNRAAMARVFDHNGDHDFRIVRRRKGGEPGVILTVRILCRTGLTRHPYPFHPGAFSCAVRILDDIQHDASYGLQGLCGNLNRGGLGGRTLQDTGARQFADSQRADVTGNLYGGHGGLALADCEIQHVPFRPVSITFSVVRTVGDESRSLAIASGSDVDSSGLTESEHSGVTIPVGNPYLASQLVKVDVAGADKRATQRQPPTPCGLVAAENPVSELHPARTGPESRCFGVDQARFKTGNRSNHLENRGRGVFALYAPVQQGV